ncbi:MAG: hypothetical protein GX166_02575 [Clostridiaceae bacterium]|jgi:hypothetical protein|nr:hypothetical protein [Clostridiaceae bacterium]
MTKELHEALCQEFNEHIGRTVTVYTTSGGCSGVGYTGLLTHVNCCFIRLVKYLEPVVCPYFDFRKKKCHACKRYKLRGVTTIIPMDKIAAFVHSTKS